MMYVDVNRLDTGEKLEDYDSDVDVPGDQHNEVSTQDDILEIDREDDDDEADCVMEVFMNAIGGSVRVADSTINQDALPVKRQSPPAAEFEIDTSEFP